MDRPVKVTRQGVRDLGGNTRNRAPIVFVCPHVWDRYVVDYDCIGEPIVGKRCGMCREVRR